MNEHSVTVALVQAAVDDDLDGNLEKTADLVVRAKDKGATIVCLQELFASKYFAQDQNKDHFKLAETIPGKTSEFLAATARAHEICIVGGSIFERADGGKCYNTCVVHDKHGHQVCKYRKVHVPHDPNYYEQFYFSGGDLGYQSASVDGVKIAPLICYDQWFPEPARILAIQGVHVIFYPTAIGWFDYMREHEPFSATRWEEAMRAHASMNGIFVAAVNRVGREQDLEFWGGSFVANPFGQIVAKASDDKEELLLATLNLDMVERSQEGWLFLKNRRPDTYGDMVKPR